MLYLVSLVPHSLCNGKRQLRPLFSMLSTTSQNTLTKFTCCVSSVVSHQKNYWHLSNFLITSQCMRSGFLISLACITPDFTWQTSWFYLPHSSSTVVLIFIFYKGVATVVLIFIFYKGVGLEFEPLFLLISKTRQCHWAARLFIFIFHGFFKRITFFHHLSFLLYCLQISCSNQPYMYFWPWISVC